MPYCGIADEGSTGLRRGFSRFEWPGQELDGTRKPLGYRRSSVAAHTPTALRSRED